MDVLVLSDDLIFASRVTGTAEASRLSAKVCRTADEVIEHVSQERPDCVILDLAHPGLAVVDLVSRLRTLEPTPRIVAYGPHVDSAMLKAARQAGCDLVLTRSQFVERLPQELPAWARRSSWPPDGR